MKLFDKVKVIKDDKYYNNNGVFKGRIGRINSAEIRGNCYEVVFIDNRFYDKDYKWTDENWDTIEDDIFLEMKISDIEVVEESNVTDEEILESIPLKNKEWWCKVENGFIMNLLGEKKNKIPYDYNT